jgi:hypothetical protein
MLVLYRCGCTSETPECLLSMLHYLLCPKVLTFAKLQLFKQMKCLGITCSRPFITSTCSMNKYAFSWFGTTIVLLWWQRDLNLTKDILTMSNVGVSLLLLKQGQTSSELNNSIECSQYPYYLDWRLPEEYTRWKGELFLECNAWTSSMLCCVAWIWQSTSSSIRLDSPTDIVPSISKVAQLHAELKSNSQ